MKKSYLKGKITRHENGAERMKKKGDQAYARYKNGEDDQYMKSQYYYEKANEEEKLRRIYQEKWDNGEYTEY